MYGNYVPTENEGDDTETASGSFNLRSLVQSTKGYERRIDRARNNPNNKTAKFSAVRLSSTGNKNQASQRPIRFGNTTKSVAEKYHVNMKELDEDLNNSFIEDPKHKLAETPVHKLKLPDRDSFLEMDSSIKQNSTATNHLANETDDSLIRAFEPLCMASDNRSIVGQPKRETTPDSGSFTADTSLKQELSLNCKPDFLHDLQANKSGINQDTSLSFSAFKSSGYQGGSALKGGSAYDRSATFAKEGCDTEKKRNISRFKPVRMKMMRNKENIPDFELNTTEDTRPILENEPVNTDQAKETLPNLNAKPSLSQRMEALAGEVNTQPSAGTTSAAREFSSADRLMALADRQPLLADRPISSADRQALSADRQHVEQAKIPEKIYNQENQLNAKPEEPAISRSQSLSLKTQTGSKLMSAPSLLEAHKQQQQQHNNQTDNERQSGGVGEEPKEKTHHTHSFIQDILSTSASRPIQNPVSAPANPGTRHNIPQRAYSSSHIQNHYQRLHEGSEQSMPEPSSNGSDERDGGRQERIDDVRSQQPHVAEKRPVSVERIDPVDKENYHFEKPPAPRGHQSQGSSSNNGAPATPLASKGTSALAKTPSLSLMSGASGPAAIADCTPRQKKLSGGGLSERKPPPPSSVTKPRQPDSLATPRQPDSVATLVSRSASLPAKEKDRTMPPPSMSISRAKTDTFLAVNGKRFKVMKLLGKGGSSRVYEAFHEEKNIVVAIKRVDLSSADEAQLEGYLNEINLLSKLQGEDRIVRLYDFEKDDDLDVLYVVMEKGDTDLASLLKEYMHTKEITEAMIKHYWTEMLHAVSVIHKCGIIHSDLKPANFLLVAGRLKLIDFGIASSVQSDATSVFKDSQMGTFNFMSPEAIQDLSGPQYDGSGNRKPVIKISYKTDVWSLGCILYNLTYGKLPFGDIKIPVMKIQAILNPNHKIPFPAENVDPLLLDVLKSCLNRDVKQRPSIESLLQHSYITGSEAPRSVKKSQLDALQALSGVLSPATFEKTKKALQAQAGGGKKLEL